MSGAAGGLGKGGSAGKGNASAKTSSLSVTNPKASGGGKAAASSGAKCNFVPGTTVLMADGTHKPIQQLQVGDKVMATDPETGKTSPQTVLTTHSNAGTKNLIEPTIDTDGKHGTKTGTLTATDNHPFWLPNQKQWKNAGDLKSGMWLRTSAGTHVQITAIKTWTKYQRVHNLTVNTDHTYYALAGTAPVLVHNNNCSIARFVGRKVGVIEDLDHPVTATERPNRSRHYGGSQTNGPAGRAARTAGAGQPCPECGATMRPGPPMRPFPSTTLRLCSTTIAREDQG